MAKEVARAVGRRKTSVARVFLRTGVGKILINKKNLDDYFCEPFHRLIVKEPLDITDNLDKYNILITVKGGGVSGQAGAICHGIARALVLADAVNRASLKANGFLTRDPRMVERKKYGKRGARKKFQFSKR